MKLHTTSSSPNGRRVAIFLAEKGVEIPLVEVDLRGGENLGESFRARNPFGRVPVLELDDGTCIAESVAISRYIECLYPRPALFGTTAHSQATIEMWNRRAELNLMMPVAHAFRNLTGIFKDREAVVPEWGRVSEEVAAATLPLFDAQLAKTEYLAGAHFSVADITLAITIDFARATKRNLPFDLPNVSRWFDSVSSRPSFAR